MFRPFPAQEDLEARSCSVPDPASRARFEEETEESEPGDTACDPE